MGPGKIAFPIIDHKLFDEGIDQLLKFLLIDQKVLSIDQLLIIDQNPSHIDHFLLPKFHNKIYDK